MVGNAVVARVARPRRPKAESTQTYQLDKLQYERRQHGSILAAALVQ